jgi:hypothetical protein
LTVTKLGQFQFLLWGINPSEWDTSAKSLTDSDIAFWSGLSIILRYAILLLLLPWIYLIAGHTVKNEKFDLLSVWISTRGNRFRLITVSFILSAALGGLRQLVQPLLQWILNVFEQSAAFSIRDVFINVLAYLPLDILEIAVPATAVWLTLNVLKRESELPILQTDTKPLAGT